MEWLLMWFKALPVWLSEAASVLIVAMVFMTSFTIVIGMWIGYAIARKRMSAIVELQFFPPKIQFRDKSSNSQQE